ncbi:MAG: hypothetical protein ACYS15_11630 [Planctomycetota bacterium]|jgi:hypothetical protein
MSLLTLCSSRRLARARPALAVVATVLSGCSVYNWRYVYEPRPVDIQTTKPGADDAEPARTLVTVVGVRREDSKSQLPASVEVRLRVENTSPFPVAFDPASFVLFSAGLERFPDPIVQPEGPVTVAPAGTAVVKAFFPFPDDRGASDLDLSGLNLRWTIEVDGYAATSSASFLALPTAYYDRYHYRIGVGYHRYDTY